MKGRPKKKPEDKAKRVLISIAPEELLSAKKKAKKKNKSFSAFVSEKLKEK